MTAIGPPHLGQSQRGCDSWVVEVSGSIGNEAGMKAEELRQKLPKPAPVAPITAAPAPILTKPAVVATNQP